MKHLYYVTKPKPRFWGTRHPGWGPRQFILLNEFSHILYAKYLKYSQEDSRICDGASVFYDTEQQKYRFVIVTSVRKMNDKTKQMETVYTVHQENDN